MGACHTHSIPQTPHAGEDRLHQKISLRINLEPEQPMTLEVDPLFYGEVIILSDIYLLKIKICIGILATGGKR